MAALSGGGEDEGEGKGEGDRDAHGREEELLESIGRRRSVELCGMRRRDRGEDERRGEGRGCGASACQLDCAACCARDRVGGEARCERLDARRTA